MDSRIPAWLPSQSADLVQDVLQGYDASSNDALDAHIHALVSENRRIHERDCINLNPGTNVMNPCAEALLASGLGSRPSLGYPGDKYEMGLEAIEQIEIITTALACDVFKAKYAEIRVGSGAMANLYAFMATCQQGDKIIVPPASIGGHVTHHMSGAAGLYGLEIHEAPVDANRYTIDVDGLRKQAKEIAPKLITIGSSLNLFPHPVAEIREIADEVGAFVLFDAAHLSGMIAGEAWANPLANGAHLMTMSTYKSLGGPPSGLIVTDSDELAQKLDKIAYPGLTANFDAAQSAALAMTLLDWKAYGRACGAMMKQTAIALADALIEAGMPVYKTTLGVTDSHQFAIEAALFGGGQTAAKKLRQANLLTCGIGLPIAPVSNDVNGLRLGTSEIVRWGMAVDDMAQIATFIADALLDKRSVADIAGDVSAFRKSYQDMHFIRTG
ncbi:MAG: aminotransferase class I/II-fold pyridoxal phosphate-dependent enzyme [Chloroflexota bacterium]